MIHYCVFIQRGFVISITFLWIVLVLVFYTQPNTPGVLNRLLESPTLASLPSQKILANDYHIFQTFNNCGPAALSGEGV